MGHSNLDTSPTDTAAASELPPTPENVRIAPVRNETYRALIGDTRIAIEQSVEWDAYDATVPGRQPWGRIVALERNATGTEMPIAVASFSQVSIVAKMSWLWAKFGPVWLVEDVTAERERAVREGLVEFVRRHSPGVAFIRLHARHAGSDLLPVMQGITFDSTVVVDIDKDDEDIIAGMKKRGRRDVRKAQRNEGLHVTEETGVSRQHFDSLYNILEETGARADFGLHSADRYYDMLVHLGEKNARLFVAHHENSPAAWALVHVAGKHGTYTVGASNEVARHTLAPDLLQMTIMSTLRDDGVVTYDLGGVGSDEFDSLAGLTLFKTKFHPDIVLVGAARDLPVYPRLYQFITRARDVKQSLNAARASAKQKLSGTRAQN